MAEVRSLGKRKRDDQDELFKPLSFSTAKLNKSDRLAKGLSRPNKRSFNSWKYFREFIGSAHQSQSLGETY